MRPEGAAKMMLTGSPDSVQACPRSTSSMLCTRSDSSARVGPNEVFNPAGSTPNRALRRQDSAISASAARGARPCVRKRSRSSPVRRWYSWCQRLGVVIVVIDVPFHTCR
ncbi:hypothetical protein [Piscicoccus intestinalis]|uniref:hypothetical protein n=1 Tax=Piscicoccus intestinalis TaxID=746033 RepID=UPI0008397E6B|nr:hypothetical protein [Piscicoccus intestinalis]